MQYRFYITGFEIIFILVLIVILVSTIIAYKLGATIAYHDGYEQAISDVKHGKIDIPVRNYLN